jgi:hypothetical protein
MVVLMRLLFEDDPVITVERVYRAVGEAYRSADGEYESEQARLSGRTDEGVPFSLAEAGGDGDLALFKACDMDLVRMTTETYHSERA